MLARLKQTAWLQKGRTWSMLRLAGMLRFTRPLRPIPGWRYGLVERADDWSTRARRHVWNYFHFRQLRPAFEFRWHHGLCFETFLGNDLSRCLLIDGCFEPNEIYWLSTVLRPGQTVIDVGANEGLYSLFAAACVGPAGRVIAVEPSSREVARLRANLKLNPRLRVDVEQIGLSRAPGEALLNVASATHAGHNTLGTFAYEGIDAALPERITLTTLDHLAGRLDHVDLIKIDVEGAELAVLEGAVQTLQRHRPVILFELLDTALKQQGASADGVLAFLTGLGYQFLVLDDATGRFVPQAAPDQRSENMVAIHPGRPRPEAAA